MSEDLRASLQESRKKILTPAPKLNLVEWADKYRYLSPESSAMPGKWKTSNVEPARGPMLAVTQPGVRKVTVMGCTQLLKTELLNNIVGYHIHQDPCAMILMQPTGSLAETWSKDRLDKMIRDTPVLRGKIKSKKSRDSGNTIGHKEFPGGYIAVIGSNSPSELASRPVRITLRDEVDKYEDNVEGDPSSLIVERSATFWNSLDVGVCSPTIKGQSRIEREYLASDRREYRLPCPHCGHSHYPKWENVKWQNNDPLTAQYQCPECTALWSEKERIQAINKGEYVATAPFKGHAGFKVNKIASPWEPLSRLVEKWIEAQGDPSKLRTFVNTQLTETWEEKGEAPEHMRLYERRSLYEINSCPPGVLFLTAGVDVQADRLECEIVGWGLGKQSWSIDYRVIMGTTSTQGPWKELDNILNETWLLSNGVQCQIRALAVDSGYNTQHVYNWVRRHSSNRVIAIKGVDDQPNILGTPKAMDITNAGKKARRGVQVWPVGVSILKSELYGFLNLDSAGDDGIFPPGFCHFPQYNEEHFKQLTAEQLVKRQVKNKTVFAWVKSYERNERLDCRNYARAAATFVGIDRFKDQDWKILLRQSGFRVNQTAPAKPVINKNDRSEEPVNSFWGPSAKSFWK